MFAFALLWQAHLTVRRRARTILRVEDLEDRCVPSLLGQQLFPDDNPWNQPVTNAPVAVNSDAIIGNIISRYGNGRLHPDFGQDYQNSSDLYGIPYNIVHGNTQPAVPVVIDGYPRESDIQPAPIPDNAVLEGDYQNRPNPSLNSRGDSHLIVWDEDNNIAYEFYLASRPGENADGRWHAAQESVWDLTTNTFRPLGWTSADAAGLPILPGLVRPDEGLPVEEGGQGTINHAIRFTLQNSIILNQYLYPASHVANPRNHDRTTQPPMGARFRLKADVDISYLKPESRVIAQAMKDYGLILADNGSNFFFSGASYAVDADNGFALTWNDGDIQDSARGLKSLTFNEFEVVDLTPVVTGLDVTLGTVGTLVTVFGQNFSGSSGNLQVFFGDTPALATIVLDDSDILAVAPPGAGSVDVSVLSGVYAAPDSTNYTDPIFGYGFSALSADDLFTYMDGAPRPPAGAWQAVAEAEPRSPSGVYAALSVNGTTAVRGTATTPDDAGAYQFRLRVAAASSESTGRDDAAGTGRPVWNRMTIATAWGGWTANGRPESGALALDPLAQAVAGSDLR